MIRKLMIALASTVLLLASLGGHAIAQPRDPRMHDLTPPSPI